MNRVRTNFYHGAARLGVLLRLSGFPGLAAPIRTQLLRLVMRVRYIVLVAALATEKEQNVLGVSTAHTGGLPLWRLAVKWTTLPQGEISP